MKYIAPAVVFAALVCVLYGTTEVLSVEDSKRVDEAIKRERAKQSGGTR